MPVRFLRMTVTSTPILSIGSSLKTGNFLGVASSITEE